MLLVLLAHSFSAAAYSGTAATTCYWDCCKMACSWNSAGVTSPPASCDASGAKQGGGNLQSGCSGGTAYACPSMACWSVNASFGFGTVAAQIMNGGAKVPTSQLCCRCFALSFTSGQAAGKKMVVQVTNDGTYSGNHFDFAVPGGGVGEQTKGCSKQFPNTPASAWGKTWGGISSAAECSNLPSILQNGCKFRFTFGLNNPSASFQSVPCPGELTSVTGCKRTDE
uniref:cellulase n=1 Tax=uncultured symbiotic protist of Mastotermes darwiniensis TaxID=403661 RepID=A4UX33_9EUKA|nr:putative glycosyl hydrolase family45 [uncultured symbiotic protist of Mastotermes darwiniensis]